MQSSRADSNRRVLQSLTKFEDMSDSDDGSWQLVTPKKPTEKNGVVYIGQLRHKTTEQGLTTFVEQGCKAAGLTANVKNCKIFRRDNVAGDDDDDDDATTYCARIVVTNSTL